MDAGSILLILSVTLLVGFVVVRPFLDGTSEPEPAPDQERSSLLAEREQVLDALQELDFDHTLGKITEEDYPVQRAALLRKGADVLERLDALGPETPQAPISDAIERAIADRRESVKAGPRQPVAADDEIERLIASRRRDLAGRPTGFCHQCGQAVHQADKFCSKCGASLR
jgi:hypothetical protein